MALQIQDRVKETTTTTGTGALTLAGAMTGFRTFASVCSVSDTCYYALQAVDGNGAPTGTWEVGLGTYSGTNTLTRTTILSSSTGSVISLAAGTTQVWIDIAASDYANKAALAGSSTQSFAANDISISSQNGGQLAGFRNRLINGAFNIPQRGTSFTPTAGSVAYTLDRWWAYRPTSAAYTVSQVAGSRQSYAMKIQRTAGDTTTNSITIGQTIESINCKDLAGRSVALSCWVKVGANYSGGSSLNIAINTGSVADQGSTGQAGGSWTTYAATTTNIPSPTTTLVKYQVIVTIPTGTLEVGARLYWTPSGTAGADDSVYFEEMMLEPGIVSTPFEQRFDSLEQLLCYRYYYRLKPSVAYELFGPGVCDSTNRMYGYVQFPVPMRVVCTTIETSGTATDYYCYNTGTIVCNAIPAFAEGDTHKCQMVFPVASTTLMYNGFLGAATTNGFLGFAGAEL